MDNKTQKNIMVLIGILFVVLIVIDRYYWAQISQWREDQATNIWLGYTAEISRMPVGLISSKYIPNPNGMIILGAFLSRLPDLLSISFFLGILQIVLLCLVGWEASAGNWHYLALAVVPSLSSVILRSTSVEYWNQYVVTLLNLLFLFWVLRYLRQRSIRNLPPLVLLILMAPALYLAGVVNAIVMTIVTVGIVMYKKAHTRNIWLPAIFSLSLIFIAIIFTWLPYFQNVSLGEVLAGNHDIRGPFEMFRTLWESILGVPVYATFQWADKSIFPLAFKHADERILSSASQLLLRLIARAYLLQSIFAFSVLMYSLFRILMNRASTNRFKWTINSPAVKLVLLSAAFIVLSLTVSSWLGGPDWLHGERPDQMIQFLPMFFNLIFLLPLTILPQGNGGKVVLGTSLFLLTIFAVTNLLGGFTIIRDHMQYRGDVLTEADVPLLYKRQVVDFIAQDWKQHSTSDVVAVDYDIDRGIWDEVSSTQPALLLTKWYPSALTEARGFDYELLRRYGLKNHQEGVQLRTFGTGRYLVTYVFEDPPQVENCRITHYTFGRLRVSIVDQ